MARDPAPWRLQALLKFGAATRKALSDLDIDLAARALLAIGEDAVRRILVSSNDFTPQRYTDFLRDVITRLSDT